MNLISIALDGLEEGEHMLFSAIYGAQGIKLPPLKRDEEGPRLASSEDVLLFARSHNARLEARRKATEGAKKRSRAPVPGEPPPRRSKASRRAK